MSDFLKVLFVIIFLVLLVYPAEAQTWFKHYGSTEIDRAYSVQQTPDGGYIVAGESYSYSYGSGDFAIYKLNSSGNKVWFKHYGGTEYERALSVDQTSDGGYIVAGDVNSYSYGAYDIGIYKLNSSGNKVWFKHYGGSANDYGNSVQQTSDGGYIVAGSSASYSHGTYDFAIYKLNSSGNKVWFKHYGGNYTEKAKSVRQTSDGGYIVAGEMYTFSYGSSDFGIYKLNSSGDKIWFKHYGGADEDVAYSIQQTSDGGYIVVGTTKSYTYGSYDFAIYKLSSSGNKVWFKHYGGTSYDRARSVIQISGGSYIVAGYNASFSHGNADYAIYKLNSIGNKIWFKHYGGSDHDNGHSIWQTSDGGFIFAGEMSSYSYGSCDFGIYKLDSSGNK